MFRNGKDMTLASFNEHLFAFPLAAGVLFCSYLQTAYASQDQMVVDWAYTKGKQASSAFVCFEQLWFGLFCPISRRSKSEFGCVSSYSNARGATFLACEYDV